MLRSNADVALNSRHVLTGSYHNYFRIYDSDTLSDVVLQADKSAFKAKKIGGAVPAKNGAKNGAARPGGLRDAMQLDTLDFNKKILHASWHPRENTIAVRDFAKWLRGDAYISFFFYRSLLRTTCFCTAQRKVGHILFPTSSTNPQSYSPNHNV